MGLLSFLNSKKHGPWHTLEVSEKEHVSPTFVILTLKIPSEFSSKFIFEPGQYLTISNDFGGKEIRRSYSICSTDDQQLQIGVRRIDGGIMSTYLHDTLIIGTKVKVHIPEGNFTVKSAQKICVFAAGSGITPIASMVGKYGSTKEFKVFYNVKTEEEILFKDLLDTVQSTYYLSQQTQSPYQAGRLDYDALIEALKNDLSLLQCDSFLICGPNEFMEKIENGLNFFGVPEHKILQEHFIPPVKEVSLDNPIQFEGIAKLEVIMDGETHQLEMQTGKQTILEALEKAKLDPPYSCRGGVCSSCKAKVTSGTANMRQNFNLTQNEIAKGYILTCQADPTSANLTLSFDE